MGATVTGDFYAASWMTSVWQKTGISYIKSLLTASAIYLETLPLFTRGLVSLPDHPTLLRELRLLERSPTKMGKDQVTHPRGCHDDHANACCGALHLVSNYLGYDLRSGAFDDGPFFSSAFEPNAGGSFNDPADKAAIDARYRSGLANHIWRTTGHWPP